MKQNSKLNFLERLLGKAKYSSSTNEAEFFCCFCNHHKKKLSINLETDRWKCWVCNKNGKALFYVIKQVGSKKDVDTYLRYYKAAGVTSPRPDFVDQGFRISLPEDYSPVVNCMNSVEGQKAWKYLTKVRGIEEEVVLQHKVGISDGGVLFPSFDRRGYLNFFQKRYYTGRKWNPPVPKGYKEQIIINELNIVWDKPVVLVEGFGDLYKSVTNTVPILGNYLDPKSILFNKVVQNKTPVILALDPDKDAIRNSKKLAKRFMRSDVLVYSLEVKPFKDVGEMPSEEFVSRFENASPVTEESIFRQRLKELR